MEVNYKMKNDTISAVRKSILCPLTFRPNMWKHFIDAGCYSYALDIRINDFFLVGDFIGKRCNAHVSDQQLIETLIEEVSFLGFHIQPTKTESPIRSDQRKIYLQRFEHSGHYHFLRQDSDGIWSHKFPQELPVQKDSYGEIILDPDGMIEAPFSGWCFVLEKR